MDIAVSEAKAQLTDLVRRAEAGEDVVLTRHGPPTVRLVAIHQRQSPEERRRMIEDIQTSARSESLPGPSAARSQDFLYDADGLPQGWSSIRRH